ncbi:LOW QUALITY PROTEIN: hypothetical protein Dda_2737 [Drechslerella dactyloides]|uniref:BOD1/SHG1 domain-containing protein n=1 Tax=Drechslerella dactyloides TaxID=74499 RepID=A0AAD6NM72_DREDA|nr:LOW QUALITY PROTEIN: hypothetical protein Dda_2737 [Drechslerella dactyloides]
MPPRTNHRFAGPTSTTSHVRSLTIDNIASRRGSTCRRTQLRLRAAPSAQTHSTTASVHPARRRRHATTVTAKTTENESGRENAAIETGRGAVPASETGNVIETATDGTMTATATLTATAETDTAPDGTRETTAAPIDTAGETSRGTGIETAPAIGTGESATGEIETETVGGIIPGRGMRTVGETILGTARGRGLARGLGTEIETVGVNFPGIGKDRGTVRGTATDAETARGIAREIEIGSGTSQGTDRGRGIATEIDLAIESASGKGNANERESENESDESVSAKQKESGNDACKNEKEKEKGRETKNESGSGSEKIEIGKPSGDGSGLQRRNEKHHQTSTKTPRPHDHPPRKPPPSFQSRHLPNKKPPSKGSFDEEALPEIDPAAKQPSETAISAAFKKKGHFDMYRKAFYNSFENSDAGKKFKEELQSFLDKELDRDPDFYDKDTTAKTASLLEGAVDRSDVYRLVDTAIDTFLAENRPEMGDKLYAIWAEMDEEMNGTPLPPSALAQVTAAGSKDEEGDVRMGGSGEKGKERENEQHQLTLTGLRGASASISPSADDSASRTPASATTRVH